MPVVRVAIHVNSEGVVELSICVFSRSPLRLVGCSHATVWRFRGHCLWCHDFPPGKRRLGFLPRGLN
eukprot:4831367-Heterocapsa_arctica.AAC.1